jgi:hypothetical protein
MHPAKFPAILELHPPNDSNKQKGHRVAAMPSLSLASQSLPYTANFARQLPFFSERPTPLDFSFDAFV